MNQEDFKNSIYDYLYDLLEEKEKNEFESMLNSDEKYKQMLQLAKSGKDKLSEWTVESNTTTDKVMSKISQDSEKIANKPEPISGPWNINRYMKIAAAIAVCILTFQLIPTDNNSEKSDELAKLKSLTSDSQFDDVSRQDMPTDQVSSKTEIAMAPIEEMEESKKAQIPETIKHIASKDNANPLAKAKNSKMPKEKEAKADRDEKADVVTTSMQEIAMVSESDASSPAKKPSFTQLYQKQTKEKKGFDTMSGGAGAFGDTASPTSAPPAPSLLAAKPKARAKVATRKEITPDQEKLVMGNGDKALELAEDANYDAGKKSKPVALLSVKKPAPKMARKLAPILTFIPTVEQSTEKIKSTSKHTSSISSAINPQGFELSKSALLLGHQPAPELVLTESYINFPSYKYPLAQDGKLGATLTASKVTWFGKTHVALSIAVNAGNPANNQDLQTPIAKNTTIDITFNKAIVADHQLLGYKKALSTTPSKQHPITLKAGESYTAIYLLSLTDNTSKGVFATAKINYTLGAAGKPVSMVSTISSELLNVSNPAINQDNLKLSLICAKLATLLKNPLLANEVQVAELLSDTRALKAKKISLGNLKTIEALLESLSKLKTN